VTEEIHSGSKQKCKEQEASALRHASLISTSHAAFRPKRRDTTHARWRAGKGCHPFEKMIHDKWKEFCFSRHEPFLRVLFLLLSSMNFHVTCELEYTLQEPAVFLFALQCIETRGQSLLGENLTVRPFIRSEELNLCGGMNRFNRIKTLNPGALNISYQADVRISPVVMPVRALEIGDLGDLSAEVLPLILPSRYCPSDRLRQMAKELFGHLTTPHAIATAASDWIFENIAYVSGSSGENSSALDTLDHQKGVCRDFAHLGITFCRALNIPARYTSCYAYQLQPQDFHACFEVLLGGNWYLFDATRLVPLNGLIRIATGRDAADAAVCTIFGNPELTRSFVSCECSERHFVPQTRDRLVANDEILCLP